MGNEGFANASQKDLQNMNLPTNDHQNQQSDSLQNEWP